MIDKMLEKMDFRQIYLALGSVAFLLLTALIMLQAKPLYERYVKADSELTALAELANSESGTSLVPMEQEVARYRKEILGDLEGVPVRQLESHIIGALQHSAWLAEVDLVSIEPITVSEGLPYQEIAFRLELQGRYFNLDDWISQVSSQLGYVVFKEYSVRTELAGNDPQLSARVLLAAYRVGA